MRPISDHSTPPAPEKFLPWGVGLIVLCIAAFYFYIGGDPGDRYRFTAQNENYYPLLVDGFRSGFLGMKADPPPELTRLADPYDPVQRQQAGIVIKHDATYYKGKYYLYFGVAPALTLFWPFRTLTGVHFPQNLATVVFCTGGYLCSLGLFLALRRRYFPRCTPGWVYLGAVMLGFGNFCPTMLARNSVWEVPIASAYFYSCLGLCLLFAALQARAGRLVWLVGAGLAFGLSVASRPHFVFFCALLGVSWLVLGYRRHRAQEAAVPRLAGETLALFLPIALTVAGLLLYNYARFANPFEFGQRYQLGGANQRFIALASLRFIPVNLYYYFLAPAQFQRYFPFVEVIRGYPGARPADFGGAEDPYGMLVNMPWTWLALAAPLLLWRRPAPAGVGSWLLLLCLGFLGVLCPTLCFLGASNRYMVDFLPMLLLVAALGLLLLSQDARGWMKAGATAIVSFTTVFTTLVAINHNGIFQAHRPATYAAWSRFFNRPALWWESRHHENYGPAVLTLRFPMDRPGVAEPLLVTGVAYRSDYLYVVYDPDGLHVRLGYSHTNYNQRLSQPIPVDFRVPHTLGISLGALYPARTHPFFASWTPGDVQAAKQTLRVTLDGVPYFSAEQESFDTTPGFVVFGENRVSEFTGRRFTGQILSVAREPLPSAVREFTGGAFVRLGLRWPDGKPAQREPLVSSGLSGQGDLLFVEYLENQRARLGLAQAGQEPVFSPSFSAERGTVQLLEASLGSFYPNPRNARERELAELLCLRLDGQALWTVPRKFHPAGPGAPVIGRNAVAEPTVAAVFSGEILATVPVQPLPSAPDSPFHFAPYWIERGVTPAYGAMRLSLGVPQPAATKIDPLVVTGPVRAQADYISINYPSPGQVFFGYLHTGVGGPQSRRWPVAAGKPLKVEIDMPSFYPSDTDEYFATRTVAEIAALRQPRLLLKVENQKLIDAPVPHFESAADQITVGENHVSEVYGPRFTGKILGVERADFSVPPGFADNWGPVELHLVFPAAGAARTEGLLMTDADWLAVVYDGRGRAHFELRGAGGTVLSSPAVPVDDTTERTLALTWGGLYPEAKPASPTAEQWRRLQRNVELRLDGKVLLGGDADFGRQAPQTVAIGRGADPAAPFSGLLKSVRRLPLAGPEAAGRPAAKEEKGRRN